MGDTPVPPTPTAAPAATQETKTPSAGLTFDAEHGLVGNRYVQFANRNIPPPGALYTTADDGLYVNVSNIQPGQALTFACQFLLPDGRLQPMVWTVNPPSTGTQTAYLFPLTEGFLFNLTCIPAGATRRGTTWVYAGLRRGSLASGNIVQTLLQDYVDSFSGPTWPGGNLRNSIEQPGLILTQYSAAVAVGQPFTLTVPAYARVMVRAIFAMFAAGAAVATRNVQLYMTDPSGNQCYSDVCEATQAASTNGFYSWGLMSGFAQAVLTGGNINRSLPQLILMPGSVLNLTSLNIQAADQFKFAAMNYEQWFSL